MNDKFYRAFGILTVSFSTMEANVRALIAAIAFGGNDVVASAFLDSSQLGTNLKILRKISRQYWNKEKYFKEIIDKIESIRDTRNLFIHGVWHPGNFGESNGTASVTDFKTKYEKNENEKKWEHSLKQSFSSDDFQNILNGINSVTEQIQKLADIFEEEDDEFHFGPGGTTIMHEPFLMQLT